MGRELRVTNINGKVYLFPVPVVKERKYLILCTSEEDARKLAGEVQEGTRRHPDLITDDFVFLTFHSDKQTKIFTLNPTLLDRQ